MDIKSITIAAIIGTIGGAGASHFMAEQRQASIDERLQKSPPVVVVELVML